MTSDTKTALLPPVVKTLVVARTQADAFRLYVDEFSMWWPRRSHSLGGDKVVSVAIEGRAGGRVFERWGDGSEKLWGTVVAYEPPRRLVHTWHVSTDPDHTSEVEVRFVALGTARTRVTLEHRHWERMSGDNAQTVRTNYESGWDIVFEEGFGKHAGTADAR